MALLGVVGYLGGCAKSAAQAEAPSTPEAFLRWSMDRYHAMPTYQADAVLTMTVKNSPGGPLETRKIRYAAPNRFSVVATMGTGMVLTCVSNGEKLVEYSNGQTQPVSSPAPKTIGEAASMQMRHPMFCGSLLYQFFGGSANFASLVDASKGAVTFGDEMSGDGELARVVKFYGAQTYGHVQALIGEKTGRVYRISYDSAPLLAQLEGATGGSEALPVTKAPKGRAAAKKASTIPELTSTEVYADIKTGPAASAMAFDVTLPKGLVAVEMPTAPTDGPPVPIGSPAPDVEVNGMDGKPVKLSSLRGHVVLLDFWATWCPPCRKGLPETAHLARAGATAGLQVLAISAEAHDPVDKFLKAQSYRLPAYLDVQGDASRAYHADSIPTTAIIDPSGNLSAYYVGLRDAAELESAVAKAGAKLNG